MFKEIRSIIDRFDTNIKLGHGSNLLIDGAAALIVQAVTASARLDQPPQPYARVHVMGHAEYVGPVQLLPRGVRVEHHLVDQVSEGVWGIVRQWKDVYAIHSIEYLTEAEWGHECELLAADVTRRNEVRRRAAADPEGYTMLMRNADEYGFTAPTGDVWGWWRSTARARESAWYHADGAIDEISGALQKVVDEHDAVTVPCPSCGAAAEQSCSCTADEIRAARMPEVPRG